ncbi:phage scaffolding protein [Virgibacillus sp. YIM 98842]|uniref:phage scaffolding protein n=1 Tax=Virgibacillus sp. YIM 98842 TaxID=2663533 RepID=UPI0013DAF1A1|nr:phage scaffolding protein [Virgibacillus sp. YIM 98842]
MNREELKALGLTDEQIDKVMAAHGKVVKSTKDKADKVEGLETQIEDYKKQLTERDKQLNDLSEKAKGNEDLQKQIQDLQQQNETTKTEYEKKLDAQQRDFAIESALRDAKAVNPKRAKKALEDELESVVFKDEKLIGFEDVLKSVKQNEPYLFEKEEKPGVPHIVTGGNPNGGGSGTITKEQIMKEKDATKRQQMIRENSHLFR